ncbi:hypothetical protein A4G99_12525 [Haladaptatus sp. R4]|nr:hypothetical protein A4G99_12525 [Haladaptatus sp. R4]
MFFEHWDALFLFWGSGVFDTFEVWVSRFFEIQKGLQFRDIFFVILLSESWVKFSHILTSTIYLKSIVEICVGSSILSVI